LRLTQRRWARARYAGVDWASRSLAVCDVNERCEAIERVEVEHRERGLRTLSQRLSKAGVTRVAIERPDGPVIEALFVVGPGVVVIARPPREGAPDAVRDGRHPEPGSTPDRHTIGGRAFYRERILKPPSAGEETLRDSSNPHRGRRGGDLRRL
jgi:hypothetical protein